MARNKPHALTAAQAQRIASHGLRDAEFADRARVAFHEAGHAVAAVLVGSTVRLGILDDRPRVEMQPGSVAHGAMAPISYAGPYAEARWLSREDPRRTIDVHRTLCVNSSDSRELLLASADPQAGVSVAPLIDRCWSAVSKVAQQLFIDGEVGHADVCAALGLTDAGGPASFELANIRAGLRAVR